MIDGDCDAAVVGAGPAGSAAATVLASIGFHTVVLEKDVFPRAKVCGEFLSGGAAASLDRLDVRGAIESVEPERIERGRIFLPGGDEVRFSLPASGIGISRFRFDEILAARARGAGADVRFGCRVVSIEGSPGLGFRVQTAAAGRSSQLSARVVVGAWGRWDALDRALERRFLRRPRRRFFGWNLELSGSTQALAGEVRLYLFRGGYCGLSRVEGGAVNLAGVISEKARRDLPAGWDSVLEWTRRSNPALGRDLAELSPGPGGFLGTGPVFFTAKPATENGILMTGDAAGVIDPFSGEGQSAALASGILAGETAARLLAGELAPAALERAYEHAWRERFARRFAWSALFRRLMLSPSTGSLAARLAGRPLVELAMHGLR